MSYEVRFWGTRGSIPTPGLGTARYGGNTPCITLERDGSPGQLVILDAGTGVRGLGQYLVGNNTNALSADLLISHTHWDHIQGLPYFAPFFVAGNRIRVWGAKQSDVPLDTILRDQMRPVVFPIPLEQAAADLSVQHVEPGTFSVDGFEVSAMRVRHPGTTLGYVLKPTTEPQGRKLAYVTDNELSGGEYPVGPNWRKQFVEFLSGTDTLVHDAMFTPEELPCFEGWGHSSTHEAVELAAEAGVRQLVMFHHRPEHDDGTIDAMLEDARGFATRLDSNLEVVAAQEDTIITL